MLPTHQIHAEADQRGLEARYLIEDGSLYTYETYEQGHQLVMNVAWPSMIALYVTQMHGLVFKLHR